MTDTYYAAIDLGSNSFHMIVARQTPAGIAITDRLRAPVRLAAGITNAGGITQDAQDRALQCLERFGQRLRELPSKHVRAVGTNALRQAKKATSFLRDAQDALGHRIEIIPGIEEARLIYLGVSHSIAEDRQRRIVVDIGGGSTECILGANYKPIERHSLYMGCVSYTQRFFKEGKITRANYNRAKIAAEQELQPLVQQFNAIGWKDAIGSSGTMCGIQEILEAEDWSRGCITLDGLEKIRETVLSQKDTSNISLRGLTKDRKPVFVGGLAIVDALMEIFQMTSLKTSKWSLREGLIYEMSAVSASATDIRNDTVEAMQSQYHVDVVHALKVEDTALHIWENVKESWGLDHETCGLLLRWASGLHELGLTIAYAGHHKHAAYLVEHCAMAGFSQNLKHQLAVMIRTHRRKFNLNHFDDLPHELRESTVRLALILRLSVLLHRARDPNMNVLPTVMVSGTTLQLSLSSSFVETHPLTMADLNDERVRLATADFELEFVSL